MTNIESMTLNELRRSNGEPINRLAFAGDFQRRKARKARITKRDFKSSGCQFLMTFEEFRQQGRRNKIRKEYGLPPLFLTGE